MIFGLRPLLINAFCLSKLWHKLHTLHLRRKDMDDVMSQIKKFLYKGMALKPEESVIIRPRHVGGLGIIDPSSRCLANQAKTMIELSGQPRLPPEPLY